MVLEKLDVRGPSVKYQAFPLVSSKAVLQRPRVLSLFDGISSGLVALKSLGVIPLSYLSSEIDVDCLRIQRFHHGDILYPLGDITCLDYEDLRSLGPIDVLFGGSPCNDLSRVNPHRRGLYGTVTCS